MEEEQHNQAFGEHTGISEDSIENINKIKNNDIDVDVLSMWSPDVDEFTDLAWRLLGRYIANNTHLNKLVLDECGSTDEEMTSLFSELVKSVSLEKLDLDNNEFGIEGVRSMIPLLQNSPNLSVLYMGGNNNINSECFEVLVRALNGTSVKELHLYNCSITDISVLETYNLPNLKELILNANNIGIEGCITISNLLQTKDTSLTELYLGTTGIDVEGVKIIANSLKHNNTLKVLNLQQNGVTEEGYKAFMKLLVDISSTESTHKSNHTLTECTLIRYVNNEIQSLINSACDMNRWKSNPGRAKVIKYQLNSRNRKKLCELQGIEYSTNNIFADIEPTLLPRILELLGDRHGQSEFYTALIPTAPDLLSYIDRRAMLKDVLVKNATRATSLSEEFANNLAEYERKVASLKTEYSYQTYRLTAHNAEVNSRLELIDLGDKKQSSGGKGEGKEDTSSGSSKKQRTS